MHTRNVRISLKSKMERQEVERRRRERGHEGMKGNNSLSDEEL